MRCSMLFGRTTELNQVNTRGVERILRAARTPFDRLHDYPAVFRFRAGHRVCLKKYMKTSTDFFFPDGRSPRGLPAWRFFRRTWGAGSDRDGRERGEVRNFDFALLLDRGGSGDAVCRDFHDAFYYGSRARSVPEYLKLRFDEKTRGFNAISFAVMTVFSSGVSMYAMGKLLQLLLGWNFTAAILISALMCWHTHFWAGLPRRFTTRCCSLPDRDGIYPLVYLGLRDVGGWNGLKTRIANDAMVHSWKYMGTQAKTRWAWSGSEC